MEAGCRVLHEQSDLTNKRRLLRRLFFLIADHVCLLLIKLDLAVRVRQTVDAYYGIPDPNRDSGANNKRFKPIGWPVSAHQP